MRRPGPVGAGPGAPRCRFVEGRRLLPERVGLHEGLDRVRGAGPGGELFLWVDLHRPGPEAFETLQHELGLHPLAVEDAVKAHQRPKIELYGDVLFTVLKRVRLDERADDGLAVGELMLFVGADFVVTVRHDEDGGAPDPLPELRQRLADAPPALTGGPAALLHAACDAVVDDYLAVEVELDDETGELDADVFAEPRPPRLAERIYGGKRRLVAFRRATAPLLPAVVRLAGGGVPHLPDEARPFFRDVADHLTEVTERVEAMERQLADVLDADLAQIGLRQNDDMRKISAWAALVAVPTLIAGVYGMNFRWMPELDLPWGYPAAIGLMVVVCWVLYRVFKRSGWL